jgi:endonuclease YncB( thermonuclease family)
MYDYNASVERVIDGDTVRMLVDHGMYLRSSQSIRLIDVHAPELGDAGGPEARDFVNAWVAVHLHDPAAPWPFHLVTEKDKQTFNRYIGVISCKACGAVLNDDINAFLETP